MLAELKVDTAEAETLMQLAGLQTFQNPIPAASDC